MFIDNELIQEIINRDDQLEEDIRQELNDEVKAKELLNSYTLIG